MYLTLYVWGEINPDDNDKLSLVVGVLMEDIFSCRIVQYVFEQQDKDKRFDWNHQQRVGVFKYSHTTERGRHTETSEFYLFIIWDVYPAEVVKFFKDGISRSGVLA